MKKCYVLLLIACAAFLGYGACVPAFDVQLTADTKDCTYVDYCKRTPQTFAVQEGRSVVTFTYVKRNEPKAYDSEWGLETRPFAVTPGKEGFVRLALGGDVGKAMRPGAHLFWLDGEKKKILFQDALGKMSPRTVTIKLPYATRGHEVFTAWTRFQVPENARFALIDFKADNPDLKVGQKVSIHRLAYYEYERGAQHELDDLEPPELTILTPSPNADFSAPLKFRITDKSGVKESATTIKIDGHEVPFSALERAGDTFTYRASTPWAEGSLHEILLIAEDTRGNSGSDCGFVAFTAKKVQHPKWRVRADGMLLKDGQPFFPFGWCRIRPCAGNGFNMDRGVQDMLANGFNIGHTYMSRRDGPLVNELLDELVNVCEKRGLLLYLEPSYRNTDLAGFLPRVEKSLFAGRARSLSFFWGIGDDTSIQVTPQQLRRYYRVCKAVDPDTLTVSADVVGGAGLYEPFLPALDILAVETYPIRLPEVSDQDMAKTASDIDGAWRDVYSAKIPNRSVMALPQNFKGWSSWKRQPTMAECKAQAYITAACRARGIIFYASTGQRFHVREATTNIAMSAICPLDEPKFKEEFFAFAREFSYLLPSLAGYDAPQQPVVKVIRGGEKNVLGGASIRCLLKADGLLIAANTSHNEIVAELHLPNGKVIAHTFPRYGYLVQR